MDIQVACAQDRHGFQHSRLFDAIAQEVPRKIHDCSPQNIATIAAAFALARPNATQVFDSIAAMAPARIHDFNARELAAHPRARL